MGGMSPKVRQPELRRQRSLLSGIVDAIPGLALAVDSTFRLACANPPACELLTIMNTASPPCLGSEVFRCQHAVTFPGSCGTQSACRRCELRNAIECALGGSVVRRKECRMEVLRGGVPHDLAIFLNASRFDFTGETLVLLTIEEGSSAFANMTNIPVCACCKQIREDGQQWIPMESYFRARWNFRFTHGYCPHCMQQLMENVPMPALRPGNS